MNINRSGSVATINEERSLPHIVRGDNDILIDEAEHRSIDLFSGHGTVWLGHSNRQIIDGVTAQLTEIWNTGGLPTMITRNARLLLASFLPTSHLLASFYSTGMEAAEFALRVARSATKKNGAIGFSRNLHGKSLATSQLGWDNGNPPLLPNLYRIPFLPTVTESESLTRLEKILNDGQISAVFVEPIQGSGGGHVASLSFYEKVLELCCQYKTLSVFDELLTGFYRTGPPFFFSTLNAVPDIMLLGKVIGNGFPVSAVVVHKAYPIQSDMLPGSTFANNPLAAAAVTATLQQIQSMEMAKMVRDIEGVIISELSPLNNSRTKLRGRGALWIIELPEDWDSSQIAANLYQRGVLVNNSGRFIRILPAATIEITNLKAACSIIAEELTREDYGNFKS